MSQNGEDVNMKEETLTAEEESQAQTLLDHGISKVVAKELLAIYETGNCKNNLYVGMRIFCKFMEFRYFALSSKVSIGKTFLQSKQMEIVSLNLPKICDLNLFQTKNPLTPHPPPPQKKKKKKKKEIEATSNGCVCLHPVYTMLSMFRSLLLC